MPESEMVAHTSHIASANWQISLLPIRGSVFPFRDTWRCSLASTTTAFAADISAGQKAASQCTVCHGEDGLATILEAPNLAGESAITPIDDEGSSSGPLAGGQQTESRGREHLRVQRKRAAGFRSAASPDVEALVASVIELIFARVFKTPSLGGGLPGSGAMHLVESAASAPVVGLLPADPVRR